MKIAFISSYPPTDRSLRSGIVYSMYNQILKHNEVLWIEPKLNFWEHLIQRIIVRVRDFLIHFKKSDVTTLFPLYSRQFGKALTRQLKNVDCDYIFSYDCEQFAYIDTEKPIIYRTDSTYHLLIDYYYFNVPKLFNRWADQVQKIALEKCKAVVTPCDWVKRSIKNDYGLDNSKVYVIESGANLSERPPIFKRKYSKTECNLVFIGIDTIRKGVDIAIEATRVLNDEYGFRAQLSIIGGSIPARYKDLPYINWIGFLDKNKAEDNTRFMSTIEQSHLFLFPTKAECAGIVNCEASAYGLPIISYDTGGIENYVINGKNGYRLPLSAGGKDFAKIINEIYDRGEMVKLSAGARNLYEKVFNWDKFGERYNKMVEGLMNFDVIRR